jgi:hypothetical protein
LSFPTSSLMPDSSGGRGRINLFATKMRTQELAAAHIVHPVWATKAWFGLMCSVPGPHLRTDVIRTARTVAEVQMGGNRCIAVMGELANHLDGPLIPAWR